MLLHLNFCQLELLPSLSSKWAAEYRHTLQGSFASSWHGIPPSGLFISSPLHWLAALQMLAIFISTFLLTLLYKEHLNESQSYSGPSIGLHGTELNHLGISTHLLQCFFQLINVNAKLIILLWIHEACWFIRHNESSLVFSGCCFYWLILLTLVNITFSEDLQ